jgi:glycogen synthase
MNLAFVTYETPYAPCGGIAAVMGRLPAHVRVASRLETVVFTPFHHRLEKMSSLGRSHEGSFGVLFDGKMTVVHIFRHDDLNTKVPFYFLLPEDTRFFAGQRHPYDVSSGDLVRDALFFGRAVAQAIHVVHPGERWTLFLQDWEAATTALAFAGQPDAQRSFITLHNSYDASPTPHELWQAGINPQATSGYTVLQRALEVTDRAVFTVSGQYARDLTEETLQTRVFAPQLQGALHSRVVGVDNGPFVDLALSPEIVADASSGERASLLAWKGTNRQAFLAALDKLKPSADKPVWGDISAFDRDDAPWFVMAGRDDPRQKGYDVAAKAAAMFLDQGGDGRFLFFPVPGDEGRPGLAFLERLAERYPENVLAFPFLFREGFFSALRAAAFGIMPSLYEPFGMANEFYLNGTAGIGRATGGITQQIAPLRSAACFSAAVERRSGRWHSPSAIPTGLLFREPDGWEFEQSDWAQINAGQYAVGRPGPDRVEERSRYQIFNNLADELRVALVDGARIVRQHPEIYCRLVTAGIAHIQQNFSWERAAQEYVRHVG